MKLYTDEGYFNFREVRDTGFPFIMVLGGRGTGKTFTALESSIEDKIKFCFMRRRQAQIDLINKPEFSPIRPVCRVRGWRYTMRPIAKGISGIVPYDIGEDGGEVISGPPVGFTAALSTLGNVRGFDSSEVDLTIYDEAVPERGEPELPHEGDKLANAYETLNRNRELEGRKPMQLICLANANDQGSGILQSWGLTDRVDRMRRKGTEIFSDERKGVLLVMLQNSPISDRKQYTALYTLTEGSRFSGMAIRNDFSYNDHSHVISRPLSEYCPVSECGGYVVYKHKSENRYYITNHKSGSPRHYPLTDPGLEKFRRDYGFLAEAYVDGRVDFEQFSGQVWFEEFLY